ncbi:hypothetical protein BDZ85DRAFT_32193 [Elsinoe ampelina]|uniref:Uncharacterized protein n=1 Tax=Elsinoe ampelina TaxID=302913 RepID=A0A6A6G3I2_9PEZI|nr:hypothetical protein BDZ85DRAFT_32193 [Elsinoe ampelina]
MHLPSPLPLFSLLILLLHPLLTTSFPLNPKKPTVNTPPIQPRHRPPQSPHLRRPTNPRQSPHRYHQAPTQFRSDRLLQRHRPQPGAAVQGCADAGCAQRTGDSAADAGAGGVASRLQD